MKIACIAKGKHPACLGGIETFQRNLEKILSEEDLKIFAYTVSREKVFKVNRIEEVDKTKNIFEKLFLKVLGRKRTLVRKLKKWKPDIIIINSLNDLKFLKEIEAKKILVQHGSFEYYLNGTFDKKENLELMKKYLDKYIFLSEFDKRKFNSFLKLSNDKIGIIRHICDMNEFKNFKIKNKKIIIVSRLDKYKRIDYIIKAMKKLPDFFLEIYGEGDQRENLENIISELKLDNVIFHGQSTEIEKALDQCSIFAMASDFEGYPISCIEAMRRGLPIILRDTFDSARDIVQGNGILLDKEWDEDKFVEGIHSIYNNYEVYSSKSLELGKRHDKEIIKEEWKNLFKELMEKR